MEPRKKKRRRKGTTEASSLMDTIRPAFIRWFALEKWREVEDLRTTLGFDLARALDEAGKFPSRGRYQHLWAARWKAALRPEAVGTDPGELFRSIEQTVTTALDEEEAERKSTGDRPLEEEPEYKAFVDCTVEDLLRAQAGQLEPD